LGRHANADSFMELAPSLKDSTPPRTKEHTRGINMIQHPERPFQPAIKIFLRKSDSQIIWIQRVSCKVIHSDNQAKGCIPKNHKLSHMWPGTSATRQETQGGSSHWHWIQSTEGYIVINFNLFDCEWMRFAKHSTSVVSAAIPRWPNHMGPHRNNLWTLLCLDIWWQSTTSDLWKIVCYS